MFVCLCRYQCLEAGRWWKVCVNAVNSMNDNVSFCDHPQVRSSAVIEIASSVVALLMCNKMMAEMLKKMHSTQVMG